MSNREEANSKIAELRQAKQAEDSLVKQVRDTRNTVSQGTSSDSAAMKVESEDVSSMSTYDTPEEAIANQDVQLRAKYIEAVSRDIASRRKVRRTLLNFYIWFTVVITACIFWVVIDPVRLFNGQASFYPLSLKLLLCGAFFANLLSIIILMVRYSFAPIDNFMRAFRELGNGSKTN